MLIIADILLVLLAPYLVYQLIRYLRRGKIIDGGTVVISKDLNSDVFADQIKMNGQKIDCIFDTGASVTSIGLKEARKIGIDPSMLMFIHASGTAVGTVENALAEAEVELLEVGPISVRNIGIMVNRFRESGCLLGMNFFSSMDSFEIKNNKLILKHAPKEETTRPQAMPQHPADDPLNSDAKVVARCPDCEGKMALPPDTAGTVICRFCATKFHADTSRLVDGYAYSCKE
jgi:clan AA aspartic protease (TIGR02281 family)